MPYNRLKDFVSACGVGTEKVFVRYDAERDAGNPPFKLKTTNQILLFIANDGLEKLQHKNTEEWKVAPKKHKGTLVDAFYFSSGNKQGYIAFMYLRKNKMWHIKSLKENTDARLRISKEAQKILSSGRKGGNNE